MMCSHTIHDSYDAGYIAREMSAYNDDAVMRAWTTDIQQEAFECLSEEGHDNVQTDMVLPWSLRWLQLPLPQSTVKVTVFDLTLLLCF
jgi:hypothetical protein